MRRGRLMLLTLLAFALPTAASANTIDFNTGTFSSGTIMGTFNTSLIVTEVGSLAGVTTSITINTGPLTQFTNMCASGFTCYSFTGGKVTVEQGGSPVFSDNFSGGLTTKNGNFVAIEGELSPMSGVVGGSAVATLIFQGNNVITGSSDVSFESTVPEPSTLLSLGTGVIGFAGMMRRKLKLRT